MDTVLIIFVAIVIIISILSVFYDRIGTHVLCEYFSDRLIDMPPENAADIIENQDRLDNLESDTAKIISHLKTELALLEDEIEKNKQRIKGSIASQEKQMAEDLALQKEIGDKLKKFTSGSKKSPWIKPPPKGDLPGPIE